MRCGEAKRRGNFIKVFQCHVGHCARQFCPSDGLLPVVMAILKTCCCWKSVRDGSFACGIYTMVFYTIFVTFGTFHLTPTIENKILFVLGLISLCVSGMCVVSSALLLVGLCADNRTFLVPWLVCVSIATLLDIFLCFYFIAEDSSSPYHKILFTTDFIIAILNIYCILCVGSQYQEYSAGRGRPEDYLRTEEAPVNHCLKLNWPSFQVLDQAQLEAEINATRASGSRFLGVPGLSNCHRSCDSISSSAKNTTSGGTIEAETTSL